MVCRLCAFRFKLFARSNSLTPFQAAVNSSAVKRAMLVLEMLFACRLNSAAATDALDISVATTLLEDQRCFKVQQSSTLKPEKSSSADQATMRI